MSALLERAEVGHRAGHEWWVSTTRADGALAALAQEWDDLHARCVRATPFQSHAWLDSWWRGYGRSGGLVLALVRRHGRLTAAAALTRRWRGGAPVLVPVGAGISDYSDVLVDDTSPYADDAARHLAGALASQARAGVIDLPEVAPGAAVWRVVASWPHQSWRLPSSMCLHVRAGPMGDLIAALPRRTGKSKLRKLRQIDSEGLEVRAVTSAGAAGAMAELLRLHRLQWRGRPMNPEHGRTRFAAHLTRAATAMIERGEAVVLEYRKANVLVCVELLLVNHTMVGGYLGGIHPDLRQRIDVTALMLRHNLELAQRLGRPRLSMLRGAEEHKLGWHPQQERNLRVLLSGGDWGIASLYASAARERQRVGAAVRSRFPAAGTALARVRAWQTSCM